MKLMAQKYTFHGVAVYRLIILAKQQKNFGDLFIFPCQSVDQSTETLFQSPYNDSSFRLAAYRAYN